MFQMSASCKGFSNESTFYCILKTWCFSSFYFFHATFSSTLFLFDYERIHNINLRKANITCTCLIWDVKCRKIYEL